MRLNCCGKTALYSKFARQYGFAPTTGAGVYLKLSIFLAVHICQVILSVRPASSGVHILQGGTVFLLPVQAVHIVQRTGARIVVGQTVHVFSD